MARKAASKKTTRKNPSKKTSAGRGAATSGQGRGRTPQAIAMLLEDHRKVQKLFEQFEKAKDESRKREIARTACSELTVHAQIEEEIFYPAARDESGMANMEDLIGEATVEHQVAKDLIARIENDKEDGMLEATFKVLTEYVNHHIEEEEGEMFPSLQRAKLDFEQIAEEMTERKRELREEQGLEAGEGNEMEAGEDDEEDQEDREAQERRSPQTVRAKGRR